MASGDWRYLLRDKVVFVTGGAGWIAGHIVKACFEHGARVVIGDTNLDAANKLKNDILKKENDEDRLLIVSLDVSDENSIKQAVQLTVEKWKTIDVLFNTAAVFHIVDIEQGTCEQWDNSYNVNLRGYALTAKHIVPILKQNDNGKGAGAIINISSISGITAFPSSVPYSTTKAAVAQMTRCLARDLGPFNIRVNSISPGSIESPALQAVKEQIGASQEAFNDLSMGKCFKRVGKAEEIANMAVFAASNLCQFMTGADLVVDGGYTIV